MHIAGRSLILACALVIAAIGPSSAASAPVSDIAELGDAVVFITASGNSVDPGGAHEVSGTGSGFLISPEGHIVTANHVVAGASTIEVDIPGRAAPVSAVILGQSECADLALLGVDLDDLPYLSWSQAAPVLGLSVFASGYPDGDSRLFRTSGTVAREPGPAVTPWSSIEQELWHDAVTAPGASGGPLVDESAGVVGVHYAGDDLNRSFAIAADEASRTIDRLRDGTGFSTMSIGLNGEATQGSGDEPSGVLVRSVVPGSPADQAGITAGDLVTTLNGRALAEDGTMEMYCEILGSTAPGAVLNVKAVRPNGRTVTGQINGTPLPQVSANYESHPAPISRPAATPRPTQKPTRASIESELAGMLPGNSWKPYRSVPSGVKYDPFKYGAQAAVLFDGLERELHKAVDYAALFRFPSIRKLDRYWEDRAGDVASKAPQSYEPCENGRAGRASWDRGRYLCYVNDDGYASLRWTDEHTNTYGVLNLVKGKKNLKTLFNQWKRVR